MYQQDPDRGAINAGIAAVRGQFVDEGVLSRAAALDGRPRRLAQPRLRAQARPFARVTSPSLGLTAIRVPEIPEDAEQAVEARAAPGRDQRRRLAGLQAGRRHRQARSSRRSSGSRAPPSSSATPSGEEGGRRTTTEADGSFRFEDVADGEYHVGDRELDVRGAVQGGQLARREADHARDHVRVHLGQRRLRDGDHRRRPRLDPARHARGRAHRRRAASGRCSGGSRSRCSRPC